MLELSETLKFDLEKLLRTIYWKSFDEFTVNGFDYEFIEKYDWYL